MGKGQWGEGFSGTTIKDTWRKPRVIVGRKGGRWALLGLEGSGGEKMQTTVIEQQQQKNKNKIKITLLCVGSKKKNL